MSLISKNNIVTGQVIQAEHVTRIIDALNESGSYEVIATGSFTGSFAGDGSQLTGISAEWGGILTGSATITGSLTVLGGITGSLQGTSSYYQETDPIFTLKSGSYATTASNTFTGTQTINGNVTINGTASIGFLNVIIESASIIYSSGSNQLGDAVSDTQTLIGAVGVSGSLTVTGPATINNLSGSLYGTASWAENSVSASYSSTASYVMGGSDPFPYTGSAVITGSLAVTGSLSIFSSSSIPVKILGAGGSGTATSIQITNGASGITSGDGMLIGYGTDNNARITLQDANSLILANSSGNALILESSNISSVNNHIIGGPVSSLNTGVRFQIESPGTGTSNYPFRINGLVSSKIHLMNGAGQVGLYKSSTTLGAILDISAPGALSTDIAFRVRNSADNATFFTVRGDQAIEIIRESPSTNGGILISKEDAYNNSSIKFYDAFGTLGIYIDNSLSEIRAGNIKTYYGNSNTYLGLVNTGTTTRSLKSVDAFSNQYLDLTTDLFNGGATFWMRPITNNNTVYAQWRGYGALNKISITDQANFSVGGETWGTSSKYVISQFTGTAPASSVTDGFQQYSADITAGNAAPHFRTEDGSVIKLYQQGAVSSSQGIADVLTNLGLLSGSSVVVDVSGSGNAFPYTGSAQITGSLIINNALSTAIQTTLNAGSNTVYTLPTASYDTAFFEYSIRSGSNARAGSIMAIQSDNTVNFTETTTTNFGDTSGVTFTVIVSGADIALTGSATTGPWTTKLIVRGI